MNTDLIAAAIAIRELNAGVIDTDSIGVHAIEYAVRNWAVFPLRGKHPAIPKAAGGRGVLDATTNIDQVAAWWGGRHRNANIGARIPAGMLLIDVDPRHGGHEAWAALERKHGPFPETMMQYSGRGDGGCHRFVRLPAAPLDAKRLGR
jgi:hypothetical protein